MYLFPTGTKSSRAGGSSKFHNRRILWRGMRKITVGHLAVLAAHDAIRRIFPFFPEACGQTHGPGRLKPWWHSNPNSVPSATCYPQASTEDSVLLTMIRQAEDKGKSSGQTRDGENVLHG